MSEVDTQAPAEAAPVSPLRWYVVHAYSGMEKAVERNLRERIDRAGMQSKFGRILVPTEEVVEMKNGKKKLAYGASPENALEILGYRLSAEEMAEIYPDRYTRISQRDIQQVVSELG